MQLTKFSLIILSLPASLCLWWEPPALAQRITAPWGDTGYTWVGDHNGDGKADMASTRPDGTLIVRKSTGRGFSLSAQPLDTPWGARQYSWAKDFNTDGKTDLATARGGMVYLHLADRTGFQTLSIPTVDRWGDAGYNWVGDYNGDGLLDIASAFPGGEMVMRFFNGTALDITEWNATGYLRPQVR